MTKRDSVFLPLTVGFFANIIAYYVTKWLDSLAFSAALSGTLKIVIWIIAVVISIRCIDYMIRRLDLWLSNRYFRRRRPRDLWFDASNLSLTSRCLNLYKTDNADDMVDFYRCQLDNLQEEYEKLAYIVKKEYGIILPEYENLNTAGKALADCANALDEKCKGQEEKRFIRFLPSNMTIKLKR